mmetsp:Transcript_50635/g.142415  ORF Transcript_50635/g.142415 Transcript_50635/m.142415 type:complete len:366 (-) Transcript_50635:58-1155(-)
MALLRRGALAAAIFLSALAPHGHAFVHRTVVPGAFRRTAATAAGRGPTMRASSSFVVDVVKKAKPGLVRIDLTGPRDATTGTGTGLIYDAAAGYIVTNAHVASASKRTTVTLASGKNVTAELWGRSSSCDVALLRVDPAVASLIDEGTPPVLGSSEPIELGEHAVAIGYSAEQFMTSAGIVSAMSTRRGFTGLGRPGQARRREESDGEAVSDADDVPVLITDASLVFGNSGGPLLNEWGEVIGLNTAIEMRGSTLGVSITIETVVREVGLILAHREQLDASGSSKSEVYLYNDPMNKKKRVEEVLKKVFDMEKGEANKVMMGAHRTGRASCGTFDNEEAERLQEMMAQEDVLSEVVRVMADPAKA